MTVLVQFKSSSQHDEVASKWRTLFLRSEQTFFLSWEWIGNWLQDLPAEFIICEASIQNKTVGLCIIIRQLQRRRGVINSKRIYLNRSGIKEHDQIWIEYNDFLLDKEHEDEVRIAMAKAITAQLEFDEIVVGASKVPVLSAFAMQGLIEKVEWLNTSYAVNLGRLQRSKKEFLSTLSRNTRYQINRSIKEYERAGQLILTSAVTTEQKVEWFKLAGPFHIQRWSKKKVGSGYTNPHFVKFHENFIQQTDSEVKSDILKVSVGTETIAYLYNVIQGNQVYFYLSAIDYTASNKALKPGLVSHFMAIQHYKELGYDVYDLMAGESRYKRSLASNALSVYLSVFQRKRHLFTLENFLKKLYNTYKLKKSLPLTFPPIKFLVSGGAEQQKGNAVAKCLVLEYDASGKVNVLKTLEHHSANGAISTFKTSTIKNDILTTCTSTEVLEYSLPELSPIRSISKPSFNDLHHAIRKDGKIYIANTGGDCVTVWDETNDSIEHRSVLSGTIARIQSDIDYRNVNSTKPHLAHPNHCFFIDDQLWVTRCDLMDAICMDDMTKRIDVGHNLIHDGVVYKDKIYFSSVEGSLIVFNKHTRDLLYKCELRHIIPNLSGWCRGIMPVSNNLALVSFSKTRSSKRGQRFLPDSGKIFLVDIYEKQCLAALNMSKYGLDTIYSVLPWEFDND